MSRAWMSSATYDGAITSVSSARFQSERSLPAPSMSSPYQMSRRLEEISKKPLTWTGSPVVDGSGSRTYGRPSTARVDASAEPRPAASTRAETPPHGTGCSPCDATVGSTLISLAFPPPIRCTTTKPCALGFGAPSAPASPPLSTM